MLNIKKAITVSGILLNNFVFLSSIIMFCWLGNVYAQMPGDFPEGIEFDPRHPPQRGEGGISPSAISENVEFVGATGGAVHDVFVQDNYAYICAGGTLTILEVSAPSNPTKVGYVALPDIAYGIYVQGSFAYVADEDSGLRIIDVSEPSSPIEVGFYDTPGYAEGVYVQGGLAYVADADGTSGLRIIDVSEPSSPVEVGFYDTPGSANAHGVYVQGSLAYVANDSGLHIIDVSEPSSPTEVGFYDTPGSAHGVYVQGSLAYVAAWYSGLRIIDVSEPSSPTEVGFYDTPGSAHGVYVQGSLAYVAAWYSGLRIIDVSEPSSPTEVGFYDTPGWASGVYVQGGLAYMADKYSGLHIIDVSVPSSPTEVGFYDTPGYAYGVYVQGGLAYVADKYSGLRIIDVSEPSSPIEVGFYYTPGSANGVYVQGLAYVADGYSGLRIIDVSVPSSPSEVGFYDTPGYASGVYVQGSLAYVADYDSGLRIIDVSIPSSPNEVGFYDTPGYARSVYVQGGLAYVADDDSGLRIIDVSVPSSPIEVGFYYTPYYARGVYVQGGLAYVADDWSGLRIIDVSVPSSPVEVGFYYTGYYGVYVQGGLAYVTGGFYLHIIDVSVPSSPVGVGCYDTPNWAKDVYVQDGFAYVADWFGGLIILRYTGGGPDVTPPSTITDLAASNPTSDSITLTWTAPGDDGDVGVASQYDIRYSTSPIDEGNWDTAMQVIGEPPPKLAGSEESFVVTGLSPGTRYYFAIKTTDEVPNWSDLSNVASGMTSLVSPVLLSPPDGSTIDTLTVELEWSAVDGATSYTVQYSIDQAFPPISEKTVTLTGLSTTTYTIPVENLSTAVYWRAKAMASGTESDWSDAWDFEATYVEMAVTSAVIDRPADSSSFKQWTETTARAYFTGTYEGEITGEWWLDGAPWEDFTVTMTKGKRTEVESSFLPTDVVDSTHNIQIKVETPSPLNSTIITYNVVEGDWGPPSQLILRAEPSIILTGGDTSTLTAIVKDAENRTVLSYDDIVTFAHLAGPGILPDNPVVTAQNGKAQITLTSKDVVGQVRVEAELPASYGVAGAEVTVITTDSDVQQYLEQIQEYIDRLKELKIEIPGWPAVSLSKSYDLSGVEEFLDTKIRPPNNPTPPEIEALKRLTFALKAIDHAYYRRGEVLGQMTVADDIVESATQILLAGIGAIAKVEELAGDIPILEDIVTVIVREASKLILDITEDVVNDAINQIPDEDMRNLLFVAVKSIYSTLDAKIDMGASLTELLADVGIRLPADDVILSNYVEKYQYLINTAVEFANNPDSITSTAKVAEAKVDEYIEKIRGRTDLTHEIIETLQWNADIANTVGDIALATGIGAVVGIVTQAIAGIELGTGILDGSITFYNDVPSYLKNAVLLAFQPDYPIPTYQLVAHNRQSVEPNVTRYQKYLRMATTGGGDFETILAQIIAAVEVDDIGAVKELLPQLIAADDNLSVSQNLAFSPLVAAHDNATNIVAGFEDAYETTSTTKQDSSGQRGLLYSNLLDYLLEPSEPATKQAVLEQAGFVLQANTAVIDNLNATVPQVFSIPALPLVMVKSYVVSGTIKPTNIFTLTATVINSGTGTAQNVKLELTVDETMTVLGSEVVEVGELENGAETTVSWQIQVAEEPNAAYSVMRIQPTSDNALTMVEFIPVSLSPLYGDVSGDEEITAYDASLILRVVVGILHLNDPDYPDLTLDKADVTGDGTVSAFDAALVLQYTVGLITDFPRALTGAPVRDAELESKLLTKAIEKLEAVPMDREGQQVLESLKRFIAEQNRAADAFGLSTALFQNFPNPFNPETWIPFELAKDANVTISIYNAKGQLMRILNLGEQKAGIYISKDKAAYWGGRDNAGEKVASGVYFYTLQVEHQSRQRPDKLHPDENKVGSFRMTRKMVILK